MTTDLNQPNPLRWWVLAVVIAAQFIYVVDAFIVNVAIPSIRVDLGASAAELQGVIVLYLIAFATLVVTGGRLGDIYGSNRIFLLGVAGFTAASLWCGLAHSGTELVVARTAQGATAALMIPQVLATIHRLFPDQERGRAFGIYGTTLGLAAAVGFGLGGIFIASDFAHLGWRPIFFVNVPIGSALFIAAAKLIPTLPGRPTVKLDLIGAFVLFLALTFLMGPLLLSRDLSQPVWLYLLELVGAVLLALFWWIELRVERRGGLPLIPLDLLKDARVATGLCIVFFFNFANIAFYLAMTLFMQIGLLFSPLQSGLAVLPLALAFAFTSRRAGPRVQRLGPTALVQGCVVQISGLVVLGAAISIDNHIDAASMAALLVAFGVGQGMVMAPLYGLALSRVPAVHAGSGAGVVATMQQIGNATGATIIGALYFALQAKYSDRVAIVASLGLLAVAVATAATILRTLDGSMQVDRKPSGEPAVVGAPVGGVRIQRQQRAPERAVAR